MNNATAEYPEYFGRPDHEAAISRRTNRTASKAERVQSEQPLVLVVDDDVNTREAIETLLELDGYRVATARDGRDALDLLEGGLRPALILLDLNMPRMDGVQFRLEQQRRPALADIPVIVCSACVEHVERLDALGSVVVLRKPMTVDCLQTAVHQQCPI